MSDGNNQLVLVTGASGFVALRCVESLLAQGYRVRGTVRSTDPAKTGPLRALQPADKLELVTADLLAPNAFDEHCRDVDFVMHTASPYVLTVKDPKKDLLDPAVQGTLSVLESALKSPTVKRVVVTSSMAAITDEPLPDKTYTEADWNETSSLDRNPYYYSKKMAEKAAWDWMEQKKPHFDLVVVNPVCVMGPEPGPAVNTSNSILPKILEKQIPALLDLSWAIIDVRDLGNIHVAAMANPEAKGRYIAMNGAMTMAQVCDYIRQHFPQLAKMLPSFNLSGPIGTKLARATAFMQPKGEAQFLKTNLGKHFKANTEKVRSLNVPMRPPEETIKDTLIDIIEKGALDKALKKMSRDDAKKFV